MAAIIINNNHNNKEPVICCYFTFVTLEIWLDNLQFFMAIKFYNLRPQQIRRSGEVKGLTPCRVLPGSHCPEGALSGGNCWFLPASEPEGRGSLHPSLAPVLVVRQTPASDQRTPKALGERWHAGPGPQRKEHLTIIPHFYPCPPNHILLMQPLQQTGQEGCNRRAPL